MPNRPTNNLTINTYRGLAAYDYSFIRRQDNSDLSIYLKSIHQFRLHDIIEIISGVKSQKLGTVIGNTRKKIKVVLEDGEVTTVLPKDLRLIHTRHQLPPGVIIPDNLAYNH